MTQNIAYVGTDINLISDFYLEKGTFDKNLPMNKISLDKFENFLSLKPKKLKNFYKSQFTKIVKLDDIKKGKITSIFDFLKEDLYFSNWDETIFKYIKNLHDGLSIIIKKIEDVIGNVVNGYIILGDESNLIIKYTDILKSIAETKKYISQIQNHIVTINDIILQPDATLKNNQMTNLKADKTFIDILDKSVLQLINDYIQNLNKTIEDINNLKIYTKVFKKYMIIAKMFNPINSGIDTIKEFQITLKNNANLKNNIDEKYLIGIMKQSIEFVFLFLNENIEIIQQQNSTQYSKVLRKFFTTMLDINTDATKTKNFEDVTQNFGTDITNKDIANFLMEFKLNFKLLYDDKYMKRFAIEMDNFYGYINIASNIPKLRTKMTNFEEFAELEFRNIFNHRDINNDLFKDINLNYFEEAPNNNYYDYFFNKNTYYEENILKIYKNINDRELTITKSTLDNDIIISSHFNFKNYGTVEDFYNAFIELLHSKPPDDINENNVIVQYILLTPTLIKRKKFDNLKKEIKTMVLNIISIRNKIKTIENLLNYFTNEIKTKRNISNAMAEYLKKITLIKK